MSLIQLILGQPCMAPMNQLGQAIRFQSQIATPKLTHSSHMRLLYPLVNMVIRHPLIRQQIFIISVFQDDEIANFQNSAQQLQNQITPSEDYLTAYTTPFLCFTLEAGHWLSDITNLASVETNTAFAVYILAKRRFVLNRDAGGFAVTNFKDVPKQTICQADLSNLTISPNIDL